MSAPDDGLTVPTVDTPLPYTTAWTDGSSTGKWGPGGWAWRVLDGPRAGEHDSGGHPDTTNQRMELLAAHEAVKALPGLLLVVSDSQYVVRCFTDRVAAYAAEHRLVLATAGCTACDWVTTDRTKTLQDDHAAHVASLLRGGVRA